MDWIFWDNDGVLVATEELYYRTCAQALAQVGMDLDLPTFKTISLERGESVFQLVPDPGVRETLRSWRDARYLELLTGGVPLQPEVRQTLALLQGKVRMAIVTGCRREHFEAMHRDSGLLEYFDFVLVREDYREAKPHPEPYLQALARSGADAARCVVVEDSPRGVLSASRAGLNCIAIPGALNAGGDFRSARWQIDSLKEIHALLNTY